ncbi:hypothetical protein AB0M80_01270 [Amycolatopsis sp. NPDC051045]
MIALPRLERQFLDQLAPRRPDLDENVRAQFATAVEPARHG